MAKLGKTWGTSLNSRIFFLELESLSYGQTKGFPLIFPLIPPWLWSMEPSAHRWKSLWLLHQLAARILSKCKQETPLTGASRYQSYIMCFIDVRRQASTKNLSSHLSPIWVSWATAVLALTPKVCCLKGDTTCGLNPLHHWLPRHHHLPPLPHLGISQGFRSDQQSEVSWRILV